ncbi:MAG: polyprenyl synthetase family protein [Myxococcales bacterium]|nr:polyprenyl synthetase family protein [Myxococcales bacterium]MDH3484241.1 polyprenyl synthetase family protein [Myxococcales bacterium]
MSLIAAVRAEPSSDVLTSLQAICDSQGLGDLSAHLADLADLVKWDMSALEEAIQKLPTGESVVHQSAHHLLEIAGKRLRPMCVVLASRLGNGLDDSTRDFGVAVELVHCATLLHDDVIDLGEQRRGKPAARTLYGNAASIFAGDWLLVDALRRVRAAEMPDVLVRLLDIIDEMIFAEAIQLENRGRIDARLQTYMQVVEGKTAALFRWAMLAGARAGGLPKDACVALEDYGLHLGVAFQLIDDYLDYAGDGSTIGKAPFADLREGKMTHPLIVALERDPSLRPVLEELVANPADDIAERPRMRLLEALQQTGALEATRELAVSRAGAACEALAGLPDSRARDALFTVARATVHRES